MQEWDTAASCGQQPARVAAFFAPGVSLLATVALIGCGGAPPLNFPVTHLPTNVTFESWVPLAGGGYALRLFNNGLVARNVRVEVWYADAAAESAQILVPVPADIEEFHWGDVTVSPQVTNGESRYPRVGTISWDGGSSPGRPREFSLSFQGFYCWSGSLTGEVSSGGFAYHVSVTLEDGNGIHTIATRPDPVWPGSWVTFTCVPRESSGVRLPPRVLLIRWEDYGGVPDSLVAPAIDDTLPPPCQ